MSTSMTGFGSKALKIPHAGEVLVEVRSANHKFLDISFHLPVGFISLEDKIKKIIESKVKRGRITFVLTINGAGKSCVRVNKALLTNYLSSIKSVRKEHGLSENVTLDTLIHLPGVLALEESVLDKKIIWPSLNLLIEKALDGLVRMRQKEGRALCSFLKKRAHALHRLGDAVELRFEKIVRDKTAKMKTNEERSSFIKDSDISEELERLGFHVRNLKHKLAGAGPVGKELDFIAQEMQREANTIAAKSCDKIISAKVIQIKGQIEKIREQVQNIE